MDISQPAGEQLVPCRPPRIVSGHPSAGYNRKTVQCSAVMESTVAVLAVEGGIGVLGE